MYILGVNCVYHESSACLLKHGRVIAAAEEERFNRVKHGKQVRADNPDELPLNAISFCLRSAGISMADISHVACAGDPHQMSLVLELGLPSAWNSPEKQVQFLKTLPNVPAKLAAMGLRGDFHWVPHHIAHAASAYYASPFRDAAVLVIDALGDDSFSAALCHGVQNELRVLQHVPFPASLGYLWELHSILLGFGAYDAAKVMGLAAYGNPQHFAAALGELVWPLPDGGFGMKDEALRFSDICYYPPSAYCDGLESRYGVARRRSSEPLLDVHHDIAAALQANTDELALHMADHLFRLTGARDLCLSGGVALNCVTNAHVFEHASFTRLFVQPAAHDAGTSLGAAYHVWNHVLGHYQREPMVHAYLGPSYSDTEIEEALRSYGLRYDKPLNLERDVARLISERQVVGFFQGALEFGPRALGNRSILADPRQADMRDLLNRKVKHREYFRPFAPSVLEEAASHWFEIRKPTSASDFMLMAYLARDCCKWQIPAVLHVDGTCRIQSVKKEVNPRFHRLISEFQELTGVPILLNTSFNDQEPIICSPTDAIETFLETEIDFLAIENCLVAKSGNEHCRRK
ncbi:MAG TPA: carbamoyltransferase C-terminal domain-containing protein [Chthoniobacterales bacterium]|nr:carbamoyltransferase C-terminal domain-containing protein [Chthoniobacterales bacterium]